MPLGNADWYLLKDLPKLQWGRKASRNMYWLLMYAIRGSTMGNTEPTETSVGVLVPIVSRTAGAADCAHCTLFERWIEKHSSLYCRSSCGLSLCNEMKVRPHTQYIYVYVCI